MPLLWPDGGRSHHIPRIGYLTFGEVAQPIVFVKQMHEYGYVDGHTATFDFRFAEGRHERLIPHAQDLVKSKPDVIFAFGDEAIAAVQTATRTIPIVVLA